MLLSIKERVEKCGPLNAYLALTDSLKFPNHYYNEEIFRKGSSGARQTMEDLLLQIPIIEEKCLALDTLRPDKFDFEESFTKAFAARVRKQQTPIRVKKSHSRGRKVFSRM